MTLRVSDASAYHTEEQRITDRTAYTMERNSFRLGVFKLEYAILDSLSAKTYWLPWILPAPNLQVKWRPLNLGKFAMAVDAGFFYINTDWVYAIPDDFGSARLSVFPIELLTSYRFNDMHTLSGTLAYTSLILDGHIDDKESFSGIGRGAVENGQMSATYELRVSRVTAFNFTGRVVLFQRLSGSTTTVYHPDEYTTIEVIGSGNVDQDELVGSWSLISDVVFSWDAFNLRLGVGYGNYNIPGLNFIVAEKTLFPSFDLYWIFD